MIINYAEGSESVDVSLRAFAIAIQGILDCGSIDELDNILKSSHLQISVKPQVINTVKQYLLERTVGNGFLEIDKLRKDILLNSDQPSENGLLKDAKRGEAARLTVLSATCPKRPDPPIKVPRPKKPKESSSIDDGAILPIPPLPDPARDFPRTPGFPILPPRVVPFPNIPPQVRDD